MTLKYDHLVGLDFNFKTQNCYHAVQGLYSASFGIELPNFACPKDFWEHGLDLYMTRYRKVGFYLLDCHPSEYRPGDVILCAIKSGYGIANHVGVFVDNGQVLHHLWGRLSTVEPYRDLLRNNTLAVLRHKDVTLEQAESTAHLLDLVSPHIKRKVNDYLASSGTV